MEKTILPCLKLQTAGLREADANAAIYRCRSGTTLSSVVGEGTVQSLTLHRFHLLFRAWQLGVAVQRRSLF